LPKPRELPLLPVEQEGQGETTNTTTGDGAMNRHQIEIWIDDLEDAAIDYVAGAPDEITYAASIAAAKLRELLITHAIVPRVATHRMISAMATSSATDDEGEFPALMDLLDFSGENARHTVLRAAYRDVILAAEQETQDNEQ